MKRMLFATSALVGATLLGGSFAQAAMMAPALKLSGELVFILRSADKKVPGNLSAIDATLSDSKIAFAADGETDSGWTYGGSGAINPGRATVTGDGASIYVGGAFGKVEMGRIGSSAASASKGAGVLPSGAYDSGKWTDGIVDGGVSAGLSIAGDISGNGIKYTSPSLSGLSFGISYTPVTGDSYNTAYVADAEGYTNLIGASATYDGNFGDFGAKATVSFGSATPAIASSNVTNLALVQDESMEDLSSIHAGVNVSFSGIGVGVGYGNNGNTGCVKDADGCDGGTWIDAGVAYAIGPARLGLGFLNATKEVDGNDQKRSAFSVEASYKAVDGLTAFGGFLSNKDDKGDDSDTTDSNVIVIGTKVTF